MSRYDDDDYALPRRHRGCACGNDLPGMCPGPAFCPVNGRGPSDEELADEAGAALFDEAEQLAVLTDRLRGDWGNDAEMLNGFTQRVADLNAEIFAALGKPRVRSKSGGLVPAETGRAA